MENAKGKFEMTRDEEEDLFSFLLEYNKLTQDDKDLIRVVLRKSINLGENALKQLCIKFEAGVLPKSEILDEIDRLIATKGTESAA